MIEGATVANTNQRGKAPEGTATSPFNELHSKKVTDLRKVFDQPHASAPFLPFMSKRRETMTATVVETMIGRLGPDLAGSVSLRLVMNGMNGAEACGWSKTFRRSVTFLLGSPL